MALYRIRHTTTYEYGGAVTSSHQVARVEPLQGWGQVLHRFDFRVSPEPRDLIRRLDYFQNPVRFFSVFEPHPRLEVEAVSLVSVQRRTPVMSKLTPTCGEVRAEMRAPSSADALAAADFTYESPRIPLLKDARDFAQSTLADDRPVLEATLALAQKIFRTFKFMPGVTNAYSPISDFIKARKGVCQDFAHFMIACLRACGLPAAYVSGYIRTIPPPGKERLVGADASHAWVSIYVPQLGWVDVDPTNNVAVKEDHIVVARGRDYADVSLLRGTILGGGPQLIRVAVTVEPLEDTPAAEARSVAGGRARR
ncbi:MAG: transglutaminase family protein [Verrucomicrobiota bacterium JB022]|nr:transglutaminase family protein [Verrucomicrobiota bacterium JB022]